MSVQVIDNFSYKGKKGNFERDNFDTLQAMRSYPEDGIDDGHVCFCNEDGNHYKFNHLNSVDGATGRWRLHNKSVNTLTETGEGKVLDARQGKILKDLIDAKVIEAGGVSFDTVPTKGSTNPVTSNGIKEAMDEQAESINSNMGVDDYPVFSASEAYSKGKVVNYNGKLYQFTSDHAAGTWTGTDVEPYNLKKDIEERYGTYTDNPEFIRVYTDAEGKFLWGIRIDGTVEWAKGVPTPVQNALKELADKLGEIDVAMWPLTASFSASPSVVEYTGSAKGRERNSYEPDGEAGQQQRIFGHGQPRKPKGERQHQGFDKVRPIGDGGRYDRHGLGCCKHGVAHILRVRGGHIGKRAQHNIARQAGHKDKPRRHLHTHQRNRGPLHVAVRARHDDDKQSDAQRL